jgi:hypothetical protein
MMRDVPAYLEPRPPMPSDPATLAAFDALFAAAVLAGPTLPIDYRVAAPRWQFICHIADTHDIVLHGSGNPDIARFEPRQPHDITAFGNRNAVYAASDGLWPMFYAVLDRDRHALSMNNTSIQLVGEDGSASPPHYFFSITEAALAQAPWRRGSVYFLPRDTFDRQAPLVFGDQQVLIPQWASPVPVTPLARIEVGPEDFPLLATIRGHDDATMFARARRDPDGFPWLD